MAGPAPRRPGERLQHVVALRQAGLPVPPHLDQWLTESLGNILAGEGAADELELRTSNGSWSSKPHHREAYSRRNRGIEAAFSLATGTKEDRAGKVIEWWDQFRSGKAVPAPVAAALSDVRDSGLTMPTDVGQVRRIVRARGGVARAVLRDDVCGTVDPEAPPIAAHGTRT